MSEPSNSSRLWSLSDQVGAILRWFEDPESTVWASTCCRRHGLPPDMAGDIHSDSWVKVRTGLARRTESFPHLHDVSSAHRYAARSMQRTAIDITRAVRRVESRVQAMDDQIHDPAVFEEMRKVDDSVMIDRWRHSVISHARQDLHCSGCPNDVVFAASLRLLAMIQIGERASISDLVYEALREVDEDFPDERTDAARQRKSRCSRCILEMLRNAAKSAGVA
jgi:hypothetical protein